ncbi:hypothetical protein [Nocardia sp. NPDC005366]|uniref:hypothetical protein n=1 Tax=Nocardia sp. NPDC005366 TaxID=3156878 RepID=UPI0033BF0822
MPDQVVTDRPRPGVLLIRLNRPDALNEMRAELVESPHVVLAETVEDVALIGPVDKICEDIVKRWKPTCSTTMILGGRPRPQSRERMLEAVRS